VFRIVEALLLRAGYPVRTLFDAPWRATTLAEFWARRWNRGFVDMTAILVHRPLRARFPHAEPLARFAGFGFSGVLHELAISVPVGAGYGGPLLYFVLHGALVELERRLAIRSRAWTFVALLLPLPLLIHRPFLEGVIAPLLRTS